jgi:F-type H+-transporting ATPase subunit c
MSFFLAILWFVSLAMVESTAIFCLVIALILIFANPFATG